jgi:ribosomal protein S6
MAKKDDRSAGWRSAEDELAEADEGGGSHVYELGFHLDPELPSEEVKKAYQAVKDVIEKQGTLVAEGEPEKIPLAYTISRQETAGRRDFDSAFFAWIAYETSTQNHEKVLEAVKEEGRIARFIDVITTKDAARHAAEMRLMAMKVAEPEVKAEGVSDSELDAALEAAAA